MWFCSLSFPHNILQTLNIILMFLYYFNGEVIYMILIHKLGYIVFSSKSKSLLWQVMERVCFSPAALSSWVLAWTIMGAGGRGSYIVQCRSPVMGLHTLTTNIPIIQATMIPQHLMDYIFFALLRAGILSVLRPLTLAVLPARTHQVAISLSRPLSPIGLHCSYMSFLCCHHLTALKGMLPSSSSTHGNTWVHPFRSTGFQKMWRSQIVCEQHVPLACWHTSTCDNTGTCDAWPLGKSEQGTRHKRKIHSLACYSVTVVWWDSTLSFLRCLVFSTSSGLYVTVQWTFLCINYFLCDFFRNHSQK